MSEIEKYKNRNRTLRIDKMSLIKTIERRNKEIERLNKCIKDDKENANEIMAEQQKEIERLNNKIEELEYRIAKMKAYFPNDIESKEKIEKAIEYINKNEFRLFYKEQSCVNGAINLLDILKGEDKE